MTACFVSPFLRGPPQHAKNTRVTRKSRRFIPCAQRIPPFTPPSDNTLSTFSDLVRGEWKGYEGRFAPDGSVIAIPDYYIPEEFSEWGLTPHGFESVHSVIVRGNKLYRKFFRILPAVTLFADHVDTEEEFGFFELDAPGVSVFDDGSWIRGEDRVKRKETKLEKWPKVEMFLRHPGGERKGVTAVVPFDVGDGKVVEEVRIVLEDWVCEYCDGADMEGGSGFVEGWVVGEKVLLDGEWRSDGGGHGGVAGVALPQGIDFGVDNFDGDIVIWVGWCVGSSRIVVRRRFDGEGNVLYSERVVENRIG